MTMSLATIGRSSKILYINNIETVTYSQGSQNLLEPQTELVGESKPRSAFRIAIHYLHHESCTDTDLYSKAITASEFRPFRGILRKRLEEGKSKSSRASFVLWRPLDFALNSI
jgi:hypothetical protein